MTTELAAKPPLLMEQMASTYGMEPEKFKSVLLKTVFPQDRQATMEQLAMFCLVAHKYNLNPLTKEIYAFPAKGGGIVPVVSIDGWIKIVQRQRNYNGHKFQYEWKDGKVGGTLVSATCQISRKDLDSPIEHTEFMEECIRGTDPWKQWPRRMLTHKSFIQAARYAFGLSGIYDQDEAERIIDAEVPSVKSEIKMPQRVTQSIGPPQYQAVSTTYSQPVIITTNTESPYSASTIFTTVPVEEAQPVDAPVEVDKQTTIGSAVAKRIHAIAAKKKTRVEADFDDLKKAFKIESLNDFPAERVQDLEDWANGKDFGSDD